MSIRITDMAEFCGRLGLIILIASIWLIAQYILNSFSVYTAAKRRGMHDPVTAWVPIVRFRTLGALCDHYDGARGIKRNWSKVLFALAIVTYAFVLIAGILALVQIARNVAWFAYESYEDASPSEIVATRAVIVFSAAGSVAALGLSACRIICLFKFYRSCRPKDAVKFLLLSLFVPFAQPVCLFCCRNYDLGMPQQPYNPYL